MSCSDCISQVRKLRVRGLRRLQDTEVALQGLNVLIGAVGKTSTLEALRLLAASAHGRLQESITRASGLSSLITHGRDSLALSVETLVPIGPPLHYDLEINMDGQTYSIATESLREFGQSLQPRSHIDSRGQDIRYYQHDRIIRPNWDHQFLETSLSQGPKMFQAVEQFRVVLGSSAFYHGLNVGARAQIREPQPLKPTRIPGSLGEDLVPCLYTLRETDRDRFDAITDSLRAAFPSFERLDLPLAAAGILSLAWKDRNYEQPLSAQQLSEGTLRFLWLITLLQSPDLPKITMIDQPEVGLHPDTLRILAGLMREATQRTQLVVATHSDRLIRHLNPEELVICNSDDEGGTRLTRGNELELEAWLEDYRLDEIWSLGRLGGRH